MVETFLNKYCARDDHSQKSIVLVFIIRMLRLFETVLSAPAAHGFRLRQQSKNRAVFFHISFEKFLPPANYVL